MGTTSKALTLLDCFSRTRPQIGLSELARLSQTNKATCFRLMSELVEHGYVEQLPSTKEYRIGPAVMRLAALRETTVPMREASMPILQALAAATGETAHMSHLVAGRLCTVSFAYAAASGMQVMMDDADVLPLHATSSGYAVLSRLAPAERDRLLAAPLTRFTDGTPIDPAEVLRRADAARAQGWATTDNTFDQAVASLALPLFSPTSAVQGALAVAAPAMRLRQADRAALLGQMVRAAHDIMGLWGGEAPAEVTALWTKFQ